MTHSHKTYRPVRRMTPSLRIARAVSVLALAWPLLASALPVGVGDSLKPLTLSDQHDRPVRIDGRTRFVIFTVDKAVSGWVNDVLLAQSAGTLERLNAVYVSDISGMPSVITQMFALPKLRKLPFSMALAREATVVADLPHQANTVTVLKINDSKVLSVQYATDAGQLKRALGLNEP